MFFVVFFFFSSSRPLENLVLFFTISSFFLSDFFFRTKLFLDKGLVRRDTWPISSAQEKWKQDPRSDPLEKDSES